ncbi:MAG: multiheme c-type cytochrome [Gemmataceae bacterium]
MRYGIAAFLWFGVTVLLAAGCGKQVPPPPAGPPAAPPSATRSEAFTGTASCSGRACHGSIEPHAGQLILQNEHTTWITLDRHNTAYAVLKNERSQRIARNLRLEKPAHEATECLVCHTTPLAATSDTPLALDERQTGVGCESCHGSAVDYLALHTTTAWTKLSKEEKQKHGMTPLDDVTLRAQTCTGCHIGSGPVPGVPARDVNHDLIAAGHPRLGFEFAAFTLNTPPHWNTAQKKMDEEKFWAVGQLVSARAALELLAYRASGEITDQKPWPEFAEYDCYACHHLLLTDSARQERGYGGFLPGSLPWSEWYNYMPHTLAGLPGDLGNKKVAENLDQLQRLMRVPDANRAGIAATAKTGAALLGDWSQRWEGKLPPRAELRPLLLKQPRTTWDQATQFYLGLSALSDPNDATDKAALASIYRYLQFHNADEFRYHSPREFRVEDFNQLLKVLER